MSCLFWSFRFFFFQAEDGIRDLVRSRGLGDVYKRQRIKIVDKGPEAEGATSDADVPAVEAAAGSTPQVLSLIHI